MIVTNANAFAKGFDYSGGTLNASYNNVEVSWNNPDEFWRLRATEVMDGLDIVTNGERRNAVVAFGCTDEAQAIRHGAWILTTEKSNPLIVSYSASFDHAGLIPGDLVVLSDEMIEAVDETGQFGGRAKGTNTLDRPAPVDGSKTFWWIDEDGVLQHTTASVTGDTVSGVTLRENQVFLTTEDENASNNLWKILSITEHADGEFAVTAVKHDPNKYTDIDGFAAA
jgi:predicted phage tail protein